MTAEAPVSSSSSTESTEPSLSGPSSPTAASLSGGYLALQKLQDALLASPTAAAGNSPSLKTDWQALSNDVKSLIQQLNMVTEESPSDLIAQTPMDLQANLEANDSDALQKRAALRTRPMIKAAIDQWWRCLEKNKLGGIEKATYVSMCREMFPIVNPSIPASRYEEIIDNDWAFDSRGKPHMDFEAFSDAMFIFMDVWSGTTIQEQDYGNFLRGVDKEVRLQRKKMRERLIQLEKELKQLPLDETKARDGVDVSEREAREALLKRCEQGAEAIRREIARRERELKRAHQVVFSEEMKFRSQIESEEKAIKDALRKEYAASKKLAEAAFRARREAEEAALKARKEWELARKLARDAICNEETTNRVDRIEAEERQLRNGIWKGFESKLKNLMAELRAKQRQVERERKENERKLREVMRQLDTIFADEQTRRAWIERSERDEWGLFFVDFEKAKRKERQRLAALSQEERRRLELQKLVLKQEADRQKDVFRKLATYEEEHRQLILREFLSLFDRIRRNRNFVVQRLRAIQIRRKRNERRAELLRMGREKAIENALKNVQLIESQKRVILSKGETNLFRWILDDETFYRERALGKIERHQSFLRRHHSRLRLHQQRLQSILSANADGEDGGGGDAQFEALGEDETFQCESLVELESTEWETLTTKLERELRRIHKMNALWGEHEVTEEDELLMATDFANDNDEGMDEMAVKREIEQLTQSALIDESVLNEDLSKSIDLALGLGSPGPSSPTGNSRPSFCPWDENGTEPSMSIDKARAFGLASPGSQSGTPATSNGVVATTSPEQKMEKDVSAPSSTITEEGRGLLPPQQEQGTLSSPQNSITSSQLLSSDGLQSPLPSSSSAEKSAFASLPTAGFFPITGSREQIHTSGGGGAGPVSSGFEKVGSLPPALKQKILSQEEILPFSASMNSDGVEKGAEVGRIEHHPENNMVFAKVKQPLAKPTPKFPALSCDSSSSSSGPPRRDPPTTLDSPAHRPATALLAVSSPKNRPATAAPKMPLDPRSPTTMPGPSQNMKSPTIGMLRVEDRLSPQLPRPRSCVELSSVSKASGCLSPPLGPPLRTTTTIVPENLQQGDATTMGLPPSMTDSPSNRTNLRSKGGGATPGSSPLSSSGPRPASAASSIASVTSPPTSPPVRFLSTAMVEQELKKTSATTLEQIIARRNGLLTDPLSSSASPNHSSAGSGPSSGLASSPSFQLKHNRRRFDAIASTVSTSGALSPTRSVLSTTDPAGGSASGIETKKRDSLESDKRLLCGSPARSLVRQKGFGWGPS